jgi:hypothetical protein
MPVDPEGPRVERAWARIDGSVEFLLSFGEIKARINKTVEYARMGGAPEYHGVHTAHIVDSHGDYA